jgi:alpha-L-arabinofuranosidase
VQTDGPEGKNCIRTTVYHVFALCKPHRSKTAVRVETQDPSSAEFSVSASRAGRDLIVTRVNPRDNADEHVQCSVGKERAGGATAQIVQANDRNTFNDFDRPDQISPQKHPLKLDGGNVQMDLPRLSVVTASMQLA